MKSIACTALRRENCLDEVVGVLLALHSVGVPLDAETMQGWGVRPRLVRQ